MDPMIAWGLAGLLIGAFVGFAVGYTAGHRHGKRSGEFWNDVMMNAQFLNRQRKK